MSAFATFFTQSPSFLDSQIRMQKRQGKNNATSLFGVHQLPCDNQIRNLLDPVSPETLFPLMHSISDELHRDGHLEHFRSINSSFLIAFDGTDFFASENISCPCCTQTTLKNGKTLNRHIALTPVLVAPGQNAVVALPPEFVQPQDGHDKQDCELAACARWLSQRGSHYAAWGITYLGDDLYCHQPHCERVLQQQAQFLFTCKPESHATLYEWVADLSRIGGVTTLVQSRRTGKKVFTDTWRYVNQVPLRNSDDALMVNWFELVTTDAEGKVLFRNAWATSHEISYHFEHNFGHGKQHLSNLFATLILLAFLVHTTLECIDTAFQSVRKALPSRQTFFEHLRALIQYLPFDNWTHLMQFMLQHLTPESIDSG